MKLTILDLTGEYAIASKDGERLFGLLYPRLKAGELVVLDFAGVRVFASPFFNASVGRLLQDFRIEDLDRHLQYPNLTGLGLTVLKKVLKNADQYYRNPKAREALDDLLKESAEDVEPSDPSKSN